MADGPDPGMHAADDHAIVRSVLLAQGEIVRQEQEVLSLAARQEDEGET